MARLAVRKTTTGSRAKKARYSGKLAKKTVATKKATVKASPVLYVGAMNQYFTLLTKYSAQRVSQFGKSDMYAKRFNTYMKNARLQMRKSNFITPKSFLILKNIQKTINGLSGANKNLKSHIPGFFKTVKMNVNKDIISFLNMMNKTLTSFNGEMISWENNLKKQHVFAVNGKRRYAMDAALKRQLVSFERKLGAFKTKWDQRLNKLSTHANRPLKMAINKCKKEIALVKKQIHTNIVLVNKILRLGQAKKCQEVRQYSLITKREFTTWFNGFVKHEKSLELFRVKVAHYLEQLKAIKLV